MWPSSLPDPNVAGIEKPIGSLLLLPPIVWVAGAVDEKETVVFKSLLLPVVFFFSATEWAGGAKGLGR